jgi:hypothetical protein
MLCRGAKGRGWYKRYLEMGEVGFQKNIPPAPFDWSKSLPSAVSNAVVFAEDAQDDACSNSRGGEAPLRPKVFFDMAIESDGIGRIVVEVSACAHVMPVCVPCRVVSCQGVLPSALCTDFAAIL